MNDGAGEMSPMLAEKVAKRLGLDEVPSGFQGRIGPYKGLWVVSSSDDSDNGDIWIECYPSQEKWNCDFEDADHRTFEVNDWAQRLTPAALNEQFIPVLENRALNRERMRNAIATLLTDTVKNGLEEQTRAAKDPVALYDWAHQNASANRREKVATGRIPFLGGLPKSDEETVKSLLDHGFGVNLKFMREVTMKLAEQRCERLKETMKITAPKSTYAFMVPDFCNVLEEGEVHMSFSRNSDCDTKATDGISRNELHGHDVLVARAPAHFPSDIQRVKAVFRPELRHLQDVIVFSIKGDVSLADRLSGGDYDGDKAWVCWDPNIVENFENAPVPKQPHLFKKFEGDTNGYLIKDDRTFQMILESHCQGDRDAAVAEFIKESFAFNMQPSLLGSCTKYKERVCYNTGSIDDEKAILLSTLVSHLVDQAKQGIIFTKDELRRLKRERIKITFSEGQEPAYKGDQFSGPATHILDWLKFKVAKPLIDKALSDFMEDIADGGVATNYDQDLDHYYDDLEHLADRPGPYMEIYKELRKVLHEDIYRVLKYWNNKEPDPWQAKVGPTHQKWLAIRPTESALAEKSVKDKLLGVRQAPDAINYWGKLRASVTYRLCYQTSPRFLWNVAGDYLMSIKAEMVSAREGRLPTSVVPGMYIVHRPDRKMVKALTAEGEDAETMFELESDIEVEDA